MWAYYLRICKEIPLSIRIKSRKKVEQCVLLYRARNKPQKVLHSFALSVYRQIGYVRLDKFIFY